MCPTHSCQPPSTKCEFRNKDPKIPKTRWCPFVFRVNTDRQGDPIVLSTWHKVAVPFPAMAAPTATELWSVWAAGKLRKRSRHTFRAPKKKETHVPGPMKECRDTTTNKKKEHRKHEKQPRTCRIQDRGLWDHPDRFMVLPVFGWIPACRAEGFHAFRGSKQTHEENHALDMRS